MARSATNPANLSKAERLRMLSRPLRPTRAPFYVQHVSFETPMPGWWWQPADATAPVPLAGTYELAFLTLARHLETRHA